MFKITNTSPFRILKYFILLIFIICSAFFLINTCMENNIKKKSQMISEKLLSVSELATTKYNYSNIISIKNSLTVKDIVIPFTEKSFVIKYNGCITAGIDLSKASFSIDNNILTIAIPNCKILSHTINENEIYIYDEKTSVFNKLSMDDMLKEIMAEKILTEEKIISEGFFDKVTINTKNLIEELFSNLGFKNIIIKIS